jgi:2-dehydro-3-deoxyglucarate aldolase/4-hydroxy-2-oxoheptanedioate aldolase
LYPNKTKERLRRNETVLGCAIQYIRSPEVPRLFAAAGFDYIFLDGEHSGLDLETLQDLVGASLTAGITPLVRVGELQYTLVARALDVGAQGIILPRMESPKELEKAIGWMRFPPRGQRGFGLGAPAIGYARAKFPEIMAHCDANTLVVAQFETRTAIERREELLAVDGIDVALIGPADLSISLGVPGEFDHPTLVDAAAKLVESCAVRGVIPGVQCRTLAQAEAWIARGIRFAGVGSEHGLLLDAASTTVNTLRRVAGRS